MLNYELSDKAEQDLADLDREYNNIVRKFIELVSEVCEKKYTPSQKGKPEPLKKNLRGWCSKRLTNKDRIIYRVSKKLDENDNEIEFVEIASCKGHYE